MRQVSREGRNKIRQWEGERLVAYRDSAGIWTVGVGHTGPEVRKGFTITAEESDRLLTTDLRTAEVAVDRYVKVPLNDNQFAALVSFVFNVGVGAFTKSTLLRKLNTGDYASVPKELLRWNKITVDGKKVVEPGLNNRRNAEIGLWAKGSHVASNTVTPVEDTYDKPAKKSEATGPILSSSGIAGEMALTATESANQLSFVADYSSVLRILFVTLMVAGVLLTIYGVIKRKRAD